MKKFIFLFSLLALSICSSAQHYTLEGTWYGKLKMMGSTLRLNFTIYNTDNGLLVSSASPDQGVDSIPMDTIIVTGKEITISSKAMMMNYKGEISEDFSEMKGTFIQAGKKLELNMGREPIQEVVLVRPQEPKKPYPYFSEDVTYPNKKADIELAATFTRPKADGKYPVVILISGSGAQNRDEELLGHKPFLVLSDHLTREGIGVLRFDDRGTGKSTGRHSTATSEDFATDVLAAVKYLKTRDDVDLKNIGVAGHSEGGMIGPMAAIQSKDISYVVMLAGPGIPGKDILLKQSYLIGMAEGTDEETLLGNIEEAKLVYGMVGNNNREDAAKKITEYIKTEYEKLSEEELKEVPDMNTAIFTTLNVANSPWMRFFIRFDPVPTLKKIKCPVLAINGTLDLQVPCEEDLDGIEKALSSGKCKDFSIERLDGLNHLFQHTETGKLSEYGEIEETFAEEALIIISEWIKDHTGI